MKAQLKQNPSPRTVMWLQALAFMAAMAVPAQSPAATLYVSQTSTNPSPPYATPDTAAHTIQPAVNAANDDDTVLVEPGQYNLTNQVSVTKAITLKSTAGAGQTVLNGQNNTRCLWMSNSLTVVDGFEIVRGYEGNASTLAGGVVMFGGTLTNCIVQATFPVGRLVYCSSGGLVTDCQIGPSHATATSGTGIYLTNSQLRNSIISGVEGSGYAAGLDGAGVYAVSSTISGCTITSNWVQRAGGGAYLDQCEVDRCAIVRNFAGFEFGPAGLGGGVYATNSVIRNSLMTANQASNGSGPKGDGTVPGLGGGVYLRGASLLNCTLTGNQAATAGGVYVESGTVTNSIVYFNSAWVSDTNWHNAGPGVFDHCCTTPDPGGGGNIIQDPQFLNPTNSNFRLATNSPCIGAGIVQGWMINAADLDGNPRTSQGEVDMGAYQTQFQDSATAPRLRIFATTTNTVVIAWPTSATGYVLEQCPQLGATGWTAAPVSPVIVNGENQVNVSPAPGNMFYRLRHP